MLGSSKPSALRIFRRQGAGFFLNRLHLEYSGGPGIDLLVDRSIYLDISIYLFVDPSRNTTRNNYLKY